MDNKALLKNVIDSLVNEDEDAAKASFQAVCYYQGPWPSGS